MTLVTIYLIYLKDIHKFFLIYNPIIAHILAYMGLTG